MRDAKPSVQNVHLDILNKVPEQSSLIGGPHAAREQVLAIVICPGGSHKLRIPDGKRGTVTCPLCGAEWFHPEAIELSDVEFRCSMSGARFNVVSSRRSPLHKFVIQKITKPAPEVRQPADAESLSVAQQLALETGARSLPLPSPRAGGWLSRLTGRKPVSSRSVPPPGASEDRQADTTPPVAAHSMDEYNWSGFSCPYCSAAGFVSCSGGHLACDGTAKLRDGRRFHQCFCGQAGFISGTIKTVESRRLSVEADVGSRSEGPEPTKTATSRSDVALLAPTQSSPPAKR
jgi:hypothetical protein